MRSPFSQMFRKIGQDSSVAASNEDLECGHGISVPRIPTVSGYQPSPSRVYLPNTQKVLTSIASRTSTPDRECYSHVHSIDQHRSATPADTPSGPSRVIGYLPRTLCNSPSVGPMRLILPSQLPQNAKDRDFMGKSEPRSHSSSVSSMSCPKSMSTNSPFDACKHCQALQSLEFRGSLKTLSSSQQENGALNHSSILGLETRRKSPGEEHIVAVSDPHPEQPRSPTSVHLYNISDQQMEADVSSPSIQYLPEIVYHQVSFSGSEVVNVTHAPRREGEQVFGKGLPSLIYPLPNTEGNKSSQGTQQAPHRSHVPPHHRALNPKATCLENNAAHVSPDSRSKSTSFEGTSENNTIARVVERADSGTQGNDQYSGVPVYQVEEGEEEQTLSENPFPEHAHQAHIISQNPMFEETDKYLWSPAASDDDQEDLSAPHTPVPSRSPLALQRSSTSESASDSQGSLSTSICCVNEPIHIRSGLPSDHGVINRPLPHIHVLIPSGRINIDSHSDFVSSSQYASPMGSRESSDMLFRYSGTMMHGASERPMSEDELGEERQTSLGNRGKFASSSPISMTSYAQADHNTNSEQLRGEHDPDAMSAAFRLDQFQNPSAYAGSGSSQTSSSLSSDRCSVHLSGDNVQSEHQALLNSGARCHILFGKAAFSEPKRFNMMSSPALRGALGPSDQRSRDTRRNETGNLPTASCSLGEQDWETISAGTEARTHAFDSVVFNTETGSSIADNSDSGNFSVSKEIYYPFHSIIARPIMEHPAHPRQHYSFMLLKNIQTGDLVWVPHYGNVSAGRLPNSNASSLSVSSIRSGNTYQHPSPLQFEHMHPCTSSPPIFRFARPSATSSKDRPVVIPQIHLDSEPSSLGLSGGIQRVRKKQTQNSPFKNTQGVRHIPRPAVSQNQHLMGSEEQSHQSSVWFDTVSKITSGEPSLTRNRGPLRKTTAWDGKGYVNGTLEQRVNQSIWCSLADASSPGASFSSSPDLLARSLIQSPDTPLSLEQGLYSEAAQQCAEFGSQLTRSFNGESSTNSMSNMEHHSSSYSSRGLRLPHCKPLPRRRMSSSENHSKLIDSHPSQKALAVNLLPSESNAQQIDSSGLLENLSVHEDEYGSRYNHNQQHLIECRGRQLTADDTSIDDPTTSLSTGSRPFVQNGVVHTDAPLPILNHPVHGRERSWDRIMPDSLQPRPHLTPLRTRLFRRPKARGESPHLHRIPHRPTAELFEHHVLLSRVYLVLSMAIPPIALLYGHGYMDGLIRLHTAGEINGFRTTEKLIALCWGYLSAVCIFAIFIALIIVSTSA